MSEPRDEIDTQTETERPAQPDLMELALRLDDLVDKVDNIAKAVHTIGSRITEYYERETGRADDHARRLRILEEKHDPNGFACPHIQHQ